MKRILSFVFLFFIGTGLLLSQHRASSAAADSAMHKSKPHKVKKSILIGAGVPSLMMTYGIFSLKSKALIRVDNNTQYKVYKHNYLWHSHLDDYFQFSPALAAFTMKLAGVKSKHKLSDMIIIYALSNILETGIVHATKNITKRMRPDGSKNNSFPSGHTATAFVAAEFLHQEYKDKSVWISIGGYTMASLVGVSRILNDKHWVSDVVAGAGVGVISTKIVYWTYPYMQKMFKRKKGKKLQTFILPSYNNNALGLSFLHRF
ncbi:MAG: phosphatase PAP2 family protein [Prevotellaceae bacterium]|nr:phosphatase PAP2 family protein [Prevotellaceae bacterium]